MTNSEPLVSIICLCRNHQDFLIEALNSAWQQDYGNIELIIFDNASTDRSQDLIKDWIKKNKPLRENCNVIFLGEESNIGISKALNRAIKASNGKYVKIMSTDDVIFPNLVSELVLLLENSPEDIAVAFGDCYYINDSGLYCDENGNLVGKRVSFIEVVNRSGGKLDSQKIIDINYFPQFFRFHFVHHLVSVLRRDALSKVGYFDESLDFEDLDLTARLLLHYKMLYYPKVLGLYRRQKSSITKSNEWALIYYRTLFSISCKYINHPNKFIRKTARSSIINCTISLYRLSIQDYILSISKIFRKSLYLFFLAIFTSAYYGFKKIIKYLYKMQV